MTSSGSMSYPSRTSASMLAAAALVGFADASRGVTPVQKVIQLLQDMNAKSKEMKNTEAVEFSKFSQFCTDTIANKDNEVKEGDALIEELSASIDKLDSDITTLSERITELNGNIETATADTKKAKVQREKDHASNTESIRDLTESVDALERAIQVLKKQNFDRSQAAEMLLQLGSSASLPEEARRLVTAFAQLGNAQAPDSFSYGNSAPPEAHGYEFQSGGILEMLQKLHDDFIEKKTQAEKEEMNSRHASDMLKQDLNDQIEIATKGVADNTVAMNEKKVELAEDTKRKELAITDRDEAAAYLKDLKIECDEKGKSFEEKQNLRSEEIKAIEKAIEILSSGDVSGAADKHLPTALLQKASLAQLRASGVANASPAERTRKALGAFLRGEGNRLHSKRIGMLAAELSSTSNPFVKVKKMISDLIEKLLQEHNAESEQKGWCDKELGVNEITRNKLADKIERLTAAIDETGATMKEVADRLALLAKEISELRGTMEESTTMRNEEKAKNEETIKDAKAAQTAVESATAILKDFYEGAQSATAFVQVDKSTAPKVHGTMDKEVKMGSAEWDSLANPDAEEYDHGHQEGMQTFGATYTGQQDEAGGVLAMLEVIQSDFSTLEAETSAAEEEAQNAYSEFMKESNKSVAVKEKETEMLTADNEKAEANLTSLKRDLADTQDQALAAGRYYDKLKPTCVDHGLSYADRAKAREEEIQSLQEALQILRGEDLSNAV
eukprot:TRINITY_DN111068_c0_g1_i1.p1 TRINITY_DN111068_c0_g1~~TRINITY_DN111068_c0_g1_i1.p1  ORF type:complete len:731 (+),score=282.49 TRINITY_DN111068_c0_g1_i1:99-2291(+)